ncbi:MAG: hypothetical protein AB7F96_20800 [Beijerinckiaceae bacterium]
MNTPRLIRHSIKSLLGFTAALSAAFVLLQAISPQTADRLMGQLKDPESYKSNEGLFSGGFTGFGRRYEYEPGSGGGWLTKLIGNPFGGGRRTETASSLRDRPVTFRQKFGALAMPNLAARTEHTPTAYVPINLLGGRMSPPSHGKPSPGKTAAPEQSTLQPARPKTAHASAKAPQSANIEATRRHSSSPAHNTPTAPQTSPAPVERFEAALPQAPPANAEVTEKAHVPAAGPTSPHAGNVEELQRAAMADDELIVRKLIKRAESDIRLTAYAMTAASEFTARYPETANAAAINAALDDLRAKQAQEIVLRSQIGPSTRFETVSLADDDLKVVRACLASMGTVQAAALARLRLETGSSIPAYVTAISATSAMNAKAEEKAASCFGMLYESGTLAVFFDYKAQDKAGAKRLLDRQGAKIFWRGFVAGHATAHQQDSLGRKSAHR